MRFECSVVDTGIDVAHKVLTSKPHRTAVLDGKIMLIRCLKEGMLMWECTKLPYSVNRSGAVLKLLTKIHTPEY